MIIAMSESQTDVKSLAPWVHAVSLNVHLCIDHCDAMTERHLTFFAI